MYGKKTFFVVCLSSIKPPFLQIRWKFLSSGHTEVFRILFWPCYSFFYLSLAHSISTFLNAPSYLTFYQSCSNTRCWENFPAFAQNPLSTKDCRSRNRNSSEHPIASGLPREIFIDLYICRPLSGGSVKELKRSFV